MILSRTIDEWNAKGGIGILHTSAASTIKQLKRVRIISLTKFNYG
jgi:hypothetical protein